MAKTYDKLKSLSPQLKPSVEVEKIEDKEPEAINDQKSVVDVPRETLPPIPPEPTHGFNLTVIHAFGQYKRGDRIKDFISIQKVIDDGQIRFCTRTLA